ncbi:hypothetical protein [Cyclobacterium qasimii]|uniref:Secretion system C-terminal sorting domain-containing protein n=2 Tax=Cyclobacterium qasimii TaxID=1350429 RepID=S7VC71_9BACT|nr:hypothetical protein [Cyclobacterium qasimii]EPR67162.1 hypothetical protein ADICYQ_3717 [Cyclobacterium qasimii M12-11B]GEO21519.1 hypothetical protein CQA01_20530 [Cyclobacterium qasimii]
MDIFYRIVFFNYLKWFLSTGLFAALFLLACYPSFAAIPLDNTCYRTSLLDNGIGDWDDPATWDWYNGTTWVPAIDYPNRDARVFIGRRNEVRLTKNEEVNALYLFAETIGGVDPGPKLNLQTNELWVFGQLHSISEDDEGFIFYNVTSGITDWIYPETGVIVFKGESRTVVDRNSWSANNSSSRFGVIFDADPSETLVVNAAFKANSFIIRSGTVLQTVNEEQSPSYTSTFSFNTHADFGSLDYGEFRIMSGAKLISEGSKAFDQIIRRTISKPASSFILEEGANLLLLGEAPVIDAVNVQLDGNVTYAGEGVDQEFLESSLTTPDTEFIYNHLSFTGVAEKVLPAELKVSGDMTFLDGGNVNGVATRFIPVGEKDQQIDIPSFSLNEFEMEKATGMLSLQNDLSILNTFDQIAGAIDFLGNSLLLDFGSSGAYNYSSGDWLNLDELVYQNLPTVLDEGNALFPFFDSEFGFQRHLLLEGTLAGSGNSLGIRHVENPGVTYDPGFNDTDGSRVVYQLNSYFAITGTAGAAQEVNIWVLSDDLGIQDVNHLRLTGDGEAAAGIHVAARDIGGKLWAGRELPLNELVNNAFAIASISELSVLPLEWLDFEALFQGDEVLLSWVNDPKSPTQYTVLRAQGQTMEFVPVGVFSSEDFGVELSFQDQFFPVDQAYWYYQVKAEDVEGDLSYSPVVRVNNPLFGNAELLIYPNPYYGGEIRVALFGLQPKQRIAYSIWNSGGKLFLEGYLEGASDKIQLEEGLKVLPIGSYFILLKSQNKLFRLRWLKVN